MSKKKKPDIMDFAGVFKDKSAEWDKIKEEIYSVRRKAKMREEADLTPISGLIKTKETGQQFKDSLRETRKKKPKK